MSALSDWTDFGKMQTDYITALATYGEKQANSVKTLAEAEQTEAQAAILWQRVDAINTVLDALRKFLNRKGREWRRLEDQNNKLAADVTNLQLLISGEPIGSWSNVWVSYKRIKGMAMIDKDAGDKIAGLTVNDNSYSQDNYTDNFHPKNECIDLPRSIKYVLSMLDWMKKQKYVANDNGQALRDIRRLLSEINNVALATKKAVQAAMDNIDDKLYFNWVLPTIGSFINSGDAIPKAGNATPKPSGNQKPK